MRRILFCLTYQPAPDEPLLKIINPSVSGTETERTNIIKRWAQLKKFLENKYLSEARTDIGLLNHPNGRECYIAYYGEWTGLKLSPEEVYSQGKQLVAANQAEVVKLGKALWQTNNFLETIEKSKHVTEQSFKDAKELIAYNKSTAQRAKASMPDYFATLPVAEQRKKLPHSMKATLAIICKWH